MQHPAHSGTLATAAGLAYISVRVGGRGAALCQHERGTGSPGRQLPCRWRSVLREAQAGVAPDSVGQPLAVCRHDDSRAAGTKMAVLSPWLPDGRSAPRCCRSSVSCYASYPGRSDRTRSRVTDHTRVFVPRLSPLCRCKRYISVSGTR